MREHEKFQESVARSEKDSNMDQGPRNKSTIDQDAKQNKGLQEKFGEGRAYTLRFENTKHELRIFKLRCLIQAQHNECRTEQRKSSRNLAVHRDWGVSYPCVFELAVALIRKLSAIDRLPPLPSNKASARK